jgi:hypothetical protein
MSIPVSCSCGQQFMAQPHLAGKQVPCPSCGNPLTIPAADGQAPEPVEERSSSTPTTATIVSCDCGASFKAAPHLLGKRVPCPNCGKQLDIPAAGAAEATSSPPAGAAAADSPVQKLVETEPVVEEGLAWDDSLGAPAGTEPQGALGATYAAPQRTHSEPIQPMTMYAIWAGAAAVVLLILVIIGHIIWDAFSDEPKGDSTAEPAAETAPAEVEEDASPEPVGDEAEPEGE